MIDLAAELGLQRIRINDAIADAVTENRQGIAGLIREQLDDGEDGTGRSLGQYSNIKYKGYLRPVNLNLTGEWRGDIDVIADNNALNIVNLGYKTGYLVKRYTENILKLSSESETKAAVLLEGDVVRNIEKQLGII
jgi:hypothetical protein